MRKTLLLLLAFVVSLPAFAQRIEKDEIDEFFGTRKIQTTWHRWMDGLDEEVSLRFRSVNENIYLILVLQKNIVIPRNSSLYILLDNKELIELRADDTYVACYGGGSSRGFLGGGGTGVTAEFFGDMSKLKYHLPKKIRVYLSDSYLEYKVKGSNKIRDSYNAINNRVIQYFPPKQTTKKTDSEKSELDSLLNVKY